jgi:nucleoside-diphosphate-sugar epimerase
MPAPDLFPEEVEVKLADYSDLSDDELRALLHGQEGVVMAAGADDRILPDAPAYDFYHRHNVEASKRLFRLAREEGVQRGVLLSSYFAYFDRAWPHMKLAMHHPYIRSRVVQEEESLAAAMPDLQLSILQLPYIFGSMPGRDPLWTPIVNLVRNSRVVLFPRGGTNMIAVRHVAEAIVGAIEKGKGGERYVVGDQNVTWKEWLHKISRYACGRVKPVITVPDFLMRLQMQQTLKAREADGKEGGLDALEFVKLQTAKTYFDPEPSRLALGYGSGGLDEAIADTVAASPVSASTSFH